MEIQFFGREHAATRESEWKQKLIGEVLSRGRARHKIGASRIGGFGCHGLGACTNSSKATEYFGYVPARKLD